MTREETIAELNVLHERLSNPKDCEEGCYSWEDGWYVEAIDMAIEALSADTSSDLISRADAIEAFDRGRVYHKSGIEEIINALPSAELPKGDLISRQWLLEVYGDYIGDNGEPKYYVPLEVVRQNIKDAPSADALLIQEIDFHKKVSRIEAEKVVDLEHKLADMVSVVRCKDCRWFKQDSSPVGYGYCDGRMVGREVDYNDYCSYGERQCNYFGERKEK